MVKERLYNRCHIQVFIQDSGSEKYIITYAKPFTLFIRYHTLQPIYATIA